ncbi:MAG: NigD-like protein [Tannerella sp.]|nr:NigD-like protein [Tannerella sp.]
MSVFLLFSCRNNEDDIYVSYGVIQNVVSKDNYEILTDKGNTLVVTKSYTSATIEDGKRILANYEILSDKDKSKKVYEVKVNGFYQLLSKPLVKESFILENEEARRDSIGNDPFCYIDAWFGGDYLNIDFKLYYSRNSDKKHMINLIYDDTRSTADTLYLTLRHNAYDEIPGSGTSLFADWGRCSFRIVDLLPEGVTSKPLKLMWRQYGPSYNEVTDCFDTGVFKKGDNKIEKKLARAEFDNIIEVK